MRECGANDDGLVRNFGFGKIGKDWSVDYISCRAQYRTGIRVTVSGYIIPVRKAPVRRAQKMAPIKQRAAFVSESGLSFGLVDVPRPGPGQILVKVVAAAQNPTDCQSRFADPFSSPKMLRNSLTSSIIIYPGKSLRRVLKEAKYGGIVGNDFAGVVEELGPDVPEGMWTIGESVAGLVLGSQSSLLLVFLVPPVMRVTLQRFRRTAHSRNT
jgi:hypothetical protein